MTSPQGATRITVQGTFLDGLGNPLQNKRVKFAPSFRGAAVDPIIDIIIAAGEVTTRTDELGHFSVQLFATDDDRITPTGWTYLVVEPTGRRYDIPVPKATPGGLLNLADVVPVGAPNPGSALLLEGPPGPRGYKPAAASIVAGHLRFTLDDPAGTVLDAGALPTSGTSNALTVTRTAAGTLSGHRVVTPRAAGTVGYVDATTVADAQAPLWLTVEAAPDAAPVIVQTAGVVVEPSWSWTAGQPVYLTGLGGLTQTVPVRSSAAFLAQVGTATAPTELYLACSPPFVLA